MDLLIFFSGREDKLITVSGLDSVNTIAVKADEKILSSPAKVKAIVKKYNCTRLFFGCIDNELQRFHVFMFLYILFFANGGGIIDEKGKKNEYSFIKLIFLMLPMLLLEAFVNIFIVLYYYCKIYFLRKKYIQNGKS